MARNLKHWLAGHNVLILLQTGDWIKVLILGITHDYDHFYYIKAETMDQKIVYIPRFEIVWLEDQGLAMKVTQTKDPKVVSIEPRKIK